MARYEDRWGPPPDRPRPVPLGDRKPSREHSPHRTPRTPHFADDHDRRHHARPHHPADYKRTAGRSYSDRRHSWPPSPLVEDEKTSLAREANPFRGGCEEVDPSIRGTLDQTPIILELDETPGIPSEPNIKKPRSNVQAERAAERQKAEKKARANAPRSLGPDFPATPEIASRTPSTYAFTPKARTPDAREDFRSHHDSGYFSTNDSRGPSSSERKKDAFARGVVEAVASDALRGMGKTREGAAYHQRHPSGPGSATGSVISDTSSGSGKNTRPRLAELKAEALHTNRRSSDSATTLPQPELGSSSPRKTTASRPASPTSSPAPRFPPSPPRSPKHSPHQSREDLAKSGRSSAHTSLPGSRTNSRPSSPKPGDGFSFTEPLKRTSTIPSIPEDRTQRTSRLVSSQSIAHDDPRTPKAAPTSLPYPVDDMNLMPSEDDHRYKPRGLGIEEHPAPSIPNHKSSDRSSDMSHRPRLDSRHTYAGEHAALPAISTAAANLASPTALNSPWSDASGSAGRGPRAPPPCPRAFATRGYDDWLTLDHLPDFDICPSCYDANFAHGPFYKCFKRVHHSAKEKLRCDFSSPWIRVAWLLTLKQHRFDLDLVYGVARAGAKEHCPGNEKDLRVWYTVRDSYGEKVDDFHVCHADVKRIEALLPSMDGLFTRAYQAQPKKRVCCFRTESKRFMEYLDHLIELDDAAAGARRKQPDYPKFADLARQKAQMRECARDDLVSDITWHFPRDLPEFTVCEECYSDVVWPAITEGSTVALRFSKTPQPSYRERRGSTGSIKGTSCQLYSPRMRRVFKKAVQTGDFHLLARRAQERKEMEDHIHEQSAALRRFSSDMSHSRSGQNTGGLQVKMQQLREDWLKYE